MANLLNYKYEIFPTAPQRTQLNRILRETKIQWNKAVTIRKKLKRALVAGQFEHVIKTCLSFEKKNWQANRRKAIQKFKNTLPEFNSLDSDSATRLYDVKNLVGKTMEVDKRYLDERLLARELKEKYKNELNERVKAKKQGVEKSKLPKLKTYWQMIGAINRYAGFAAKTYIDKSFKCPKRMALSTVRFNVSGSADSIRWNQAVNPKQGQRAYGATGEPQYKRRGDGFAYQIQQNTNIADLIRTKNKKSGHRIFINALHKGNAWIDMAYHREIPNGSKIKQLTVNAKAGRYFVVLSTEVPDSEWQIVPMKTGWNAGIGPGAQTALTVALKNSKNGELAHLAIHYEFLEKSLDKLEKLQQALASKHGPRRKRTPKEIEESINQFRKKRSVQKLSPEEQEKSVAKERERLEKRMIPQEASKRWRRWVQKVSALQMKTANQRADVLHKISRALVEGCDVIGIGHWEPEREVSYRKKLRAAKKKVKMGVDGAVEELKALKEEKSKQGTKGSKKKRRGGRDRSIATLRRLVEEKAERASVKALPNVNEAYSTIRCSNCGSETGPKKDLSVREWRCGKCKAVHHRDLNSAFNILKKTEMELASAQEVASETGSTVTRTTAQGAMGQTGCEPGLHATGSSGRGDSFFYGHVGAIPNLWDKEVPKALKSLIHMGIARPLTMQSVAETGPGNPP